MSTTVRDTVCAQSSMRLGMTDTLDGATAPNTEYVFGTAGQLRLTGVHPTKGVVVARPMTSRNGSRYR